MKISDNADIQAIADKKESDAISDASDYFYEFDNDDMYDCQGIFDRGMAVGARLATLARKRRRTENEKGIRIFSVTYGVNGDNDATAYFVGTFESVKKKLEELPDSSGD